MICLYTHAPPVRNDHTSPHLAKVWGLSGCVGDGYLSRNAAVVEQPAAARHCTMALGMSELRAREANLRSDQAKRIDAEKRRLEKERVLAERQRRREEEREAEKARRRTEAAEKQRLVRVRRLHACMGGVPGVTAESNSCQSGTTWPHMRATLVLCCMPTTTATGIPWTR